MRWLGRILTLLLALWLVLSVFDQPLQWQGWRKSTSGSWDADFGAYPVFWLEAKQPLNFDIPANAEQIRVQLTPGSANVDTDSLYTIVYRTINKAGETISEARRIYDHTNTTAEDLDSEVLADRFFDHPDGIAAHFTSGFFIDNQTNNPVAGLQISLEKAPGFVVAVRVSVLERKKEAELPVLWQRMHRDKRAALMAEHIYPPQLVTEGERRTALRYSWLPIGPGGIKGEAYQTATLFIRHQISLVASLASNTSNKPSTGHILADEHKDKTVEKPVNVVRGYFARPNQPLTYALALNSTVSQPLRLDIRGLSASKNGVNWQVLDKEGHRLLAGHLPATSHQDIYETLPQASDNTLYGKSSRYIMAPANSATLVVDSPVEQMMINVFTRPLNLGHLMDEKQPKWFMTLPSGHQSLKANGASQIFYQQQRPLLADVNDNEPSKWLTLKTSSDEPSFALLEPGGSGYQPIGKGRWSGVFSGKKDISPELVYLQTHPMTSPQKVTVTIDNEHRIEHWLTAAAGRLSLPGLTSGKHPININGPAQTQWFINLPQGNQPQEKQPQKKQEQGYRIRNAYALTKTLTFNIQKQAGQEWISFHYFPATAQAHEISIKLNHDYQHGESEEHTVPLRRYQITAVQNKASVYVLNQNRPALWPGTILKFALDADLLNRHYALTVTSDAAEVGFIQASYVLDGVTDSLQLYREVKQ